MPQDLFQRVDILSSLLRNLGTRDQADDQAIEEAAGCPIPAYEVTHGDPDHVRRRAVIWMELVRVARAIRESGSSYNTFTRMRRAALTQSEAERIWSQATQPTPESVIMGWKVLLLLGEVEEQLRQLDGDGDSQQASKLRKNAKPFLRQWLALTTPEPRRHDTHFHAQVLPAEFIEERIALWASARLLVEQRINAL